MSYTWQMSDDMNFKVETVSNLKLIPANVTCDHKTIGSWCRTVEVKWDKTTNDVTELMQCNTCWKYYFVVHRNVPFITWGETE